jgi:hypothetical protein
MIITMEVVPNGRAKGFFADDPENLREEGLEDRVGLLIGFWRSFESEPIGN